MSSPQFDARRQLVHLLTPEGLPRAMLFDLFARIDVYRTALLADAHNAAVSETGRSVMDGVGTEAEQAEVGFGIAEPDTGALPRIVMAFYETDAPAQAGLMLAAGHKKWRCVQAPRKLDAAHDNPGTIAAWCAPGDTLVLRHPASGAAHAVAACLAPGIRIINVADGLHAAPLAALCDVAQLWRRLPELNTRVIALVGDLRANARLRCVIHMLTTLGVPQVSVVHTSDALPPGAARLGAHVYAVSESAAGTASADVVMSYGDDLVFHGLPAAQGDEPDLAHAAVFMAVYDVMVGQV